MHGGVDETGTRTWPIRPNLSHTALTDSFHLPGFPLKVERERTSG
jgi:hypothetical protein